MYIYQHVYLCAIPHTQFLRTCQLPTSLLCNKAAVKNRCLQVCSNYNVVMMCIYIPARVHRADGVYTGRFKEGHQQLWWRQLLGFGGFGSVYSGVLRRTPVAIKILIWVAYYRGLQISCLVVLGDGCLRSNRKTCTNSIFYYVAWTLVSISCMD